VVDFGEVLVIAVVEDVVVVTEEMGVTGGDVDGTDQGDVEDVMATRVSGFL
jgi:hypothetical protein